MKILLFALATLFLLSAPFQLVAQTNTNAVVNPPHPHGPDSQMLSFLSPADRDKFFAVFAKTAADNPALQAEGEELKAEGRELRENGGGFEDQIALMDKFTAYQEKVHQAMVKTDPTIEPILAQIEQRISQAKTQRMSDMQGSSAATKPGVTNTPAAIKPPASH